MKKVFKGIKYEKYYKDLIPYLKKQKNQQYFAVILTLGATIFFALFAINPTISTIVKLRKEIVDSRFVESQLSQKVNNLSSLSREYSKIEEDIPFILDGIPIAPEAPTLAAQIQSIAEGSGVRIANLEISTISLTNKETASTSSSFKFQISALSSLENLQKFTQDIVDMQRIVSIESVSITTTADVNSNLQLDLKGTAYFKTQ